MRRSNSGIDESDPHSETDTEYAVLTMFIFIPSQGFFVSLLLCLTNAEVRKSFHPFLLKVISRVHESPLIANITLEELSRNASNELR